ncbi:hypothetical protein [Domibacillus robiginosus]|uniref:hypothetical protein n=1 Tax=Domibacillus robiginosus TaxID=1071054 RepID=UPI00067D6B87|nr:hypothetical protein [Domibacillus robiginosus]
MPKPASINDSSVIPQIVKEAIKKEKGHFVSDAELSAYIRVTPKAVLMDLCMDLFKEELSVADIFHVIKNTYHIDLNEKTLLPKQKARVLQAYSLKESDAAVASLPAIAMDLQVKQHEGSLTSADVRTMVNQLFGINLAGISELDAARISLYSKGQWLSQSETNLFIVYTGTGDIDARIVPTDYFTEKTGLKIVPDDLQQSLATLGFYYDETIQSVYYTNPSGEAVPNDFKVKTMKMIEKYIKHNYSHL